MDCRSFRKQHFAYLDDTLPGNKMAEAQQHIMTCDACAAHDTLVRRSLMLVHNLPTLEPSADFLERMRARIDAERDGTEAPEFRSNESAITMWWHSAMARPMTMGTMAAAGMLVIGTLVWRGITPREEVVTAMQPVTVTQPALDTVVEPLPYISPAMMQAMATGNPVWPAAILVDDTPTQMVNGEFSLVKATR